MRERQEKRGSEDWFSLHCVCAPSPPSFPPSPSFLFSLSLCLFGHHCSLFSRTTASNAVHPLVGNGTDGRQCIWMAPIGLDDVKAVGKASKCSFDPCGFVQCRVTVTSVMLAIIGGTTTKSKCSSCPSLSMANDIIYLIQDQKYTPTALLSNPRTLCH
jgi:hypothetical protein